MLSFVNRLQTTIVALKISFHNGAQPAKWKSNLGIRQVVGSISLHTNTHTQKKKKERETNGNP